MNIIDKKYLDKTTELSKESKCQFLSVGCIIVSNDNIIVSGVNGSVSKTINCCE